MAQTKDHNLNWGNIVDLPKNINNPQAIFKSKSKGFVVLTYVKDVNKKPVMVMVSVHLDDKNEVVNIASIYARSNFNTYKTWIKEGLALFVDKKSELFPYTQATIAVGGNNPQSDKNTKTKPNSKKSGLKSPIIEPKPTEGGPSYSGESPRPGIMIIKTANYTLAGFNPSFLLDGLGIPSPSGRPGGDQKFQS